MPAGTLLLAAGVAGAAWVASFVALLAASTRRRSTAPCPAGDADVRPAVVSLLINGAVTRQAVDGTFLDLCARGYLSPVVVDDASWACGLVAPRWSRRTRDALLSSP